MFNRSKKTRFLTLGLAAFGFILIGGHFSQADAQKRDPFATPAWMKQKVTVQPGVMKDGKPVKKGPPPVLPVEAPPIQSRIDYYKRLREEYAASGMQLPKVTSVLTLSEMVVTGIFKTPRGFAAMVQATPINLSYTIYPGEKFFDGQLVAIEENRLTFRKVTKMSNGKFIASVENKNLRDYDSKSPIQAPVPTENASRTTEVVNNATTSQPATVAAQSEDKTKPNAPAQIVSPLDEMNKQPESKPEEADKDKSKKNKKPTKVAKKS